MFRDRFDAANQLVHSLMEYHEKPHTLILALSRTGLEVGYVLSRELRLPLDVFLSKTIHYPGNPDYAVGLVAFDTVIIDKKWREISGDFNGKLTQEISNLKQELMRQAHRYRGDKHPLTLAGNTVILVDDGLATGKGIEQMLEIIKKQGPAKVVLAAPVIAKDALQMLKGKVDEIVFLVSPDEFKSLNQFYKSFPEVDEMQAVTLLHGSY